MRRVTHEAFSGSSSVAYQPLQEKGAALLLDRLLQEPEQWKAHIEHSIATTMLATVYDWSSANAETSMLVERIYNLAHRIAYAAIPGNFLVEMFPMMMYLPEWMAKWKREGLAWFRKDTDMFIELMNGVNDKLVCTSSLAYICEMLIRAPRAGRQYSGPVFRSKADRRSG